MARWKVGALRVRGEMTLNHCSKAALAVVLQGMEQQPNAYVYAIAVDGVVRYIGKGNGNRTKEHLRIVARLAEGLPGGPKEQVVHRRLAKAKKAGSEIAIERISSGLTDSEAYELERVEIAKGMATGELWNLHEGGIGATSEFARAKWQDPQYRANQAAAVRDPRVRQRRSEAQREAQNRPDVRQRVRAAQRNAWARPECRANKVAAAERNWSSQEYRDAVVAGRKAQWTQELRAKQSRTLSKLWSEPAARAAQRARLRAVWDDPQRKAEMLAARRATKLRNAK